MATKKKTVTRAKKITNAKSFTNGLVTETSTNKLISNGLLAAMNGVGFDFDISNFGTPLNQIDTLFKNNRWYLASNFRQLLSESYVEHGIIQTVVDVPVDDGMRGGVDIKSKELDPDEIEELKVEMEQEDDLGKVGQAQKWNRLFGGGGILILTDQDSSTPLEVTAIAQDSPLEFRPVEMWELFWDKQNTEGYDVELQEQEFEYYNYYGRKVHKSRVLKLKGFTAPSFIRPRLRGWGFSVVEVLINSINQYLKANNLIFEVLDEFKVDAYKIKNLTSTLLSPQGEQNVMKRLAIANRQKNFQHAIIMDGEDDFIQKELSFAGLADTMVGIRMQIASDLRMPISKVFGIASTGFSSGEDDIENYNGMVESQIRQKSKHHIIKIIQLRCQKLFGMVPDDLRIEFKPLRVLSAEQEQNVKTQQFARLLQASQAGMMTTEEFKEAVNRDNLLGIQLDTSIEQIEMPTQETDGANEPDSAKMGGGKKSATAPKETPKAKNSKDDEYYDNEQPDDYDPKRAKGEYGGQKQKLSNPGTVDETKWAKAKERSKAEYGEIKWPVVTYIYKKEGGTFK